MMELSLDAINACSPYVVTLTPQGFTFQTELGIHYNISFHILYICDTSDGREAKRDRLFLMWFEKHADPERFTIRTTHVKIEEETLYIAVIVEKRNPLYSDIQKQIDHDVALLSEKPD